MVYGIATARRAWLTAEQVANTRPWREFSKLASARGGESGRNGASETALDAFRARSV